MPLADGTRLGPYEILAPIGAGGMGEVYRARDTRLDREVAVKILTPELARDPERQQRFEREARAIAALSHPHVCAVYDVGREGDLHFLVMELLDGQPLSARLLIGALPFDEAAPIALTVVESLAALHGRGLVHRDLKPGNIFLSRHGVKLLDFGLARHFQTAEMLDTAITREGMVLGSPRYMAPEQVRGGAVDHRTDLFAAAVVIHEMLAGRTPFDRAAAIDVLHAITYEQPDPLPAGVAPDAFARALRQALAKDPGQRPQSAEAFGAALRAAADTSRTTSVGTVVPPRTPLSRVIVLPLRVLRPDPETDFLGFSLADAVTASLAGIDSIVVRSSMTAAQLATASLDLRVLAEQADVDVVLTGTLLRVGQQVRVAAQLVEVPQGALLWSHTVQAPVEDLFQLQDALSNAIVSSLHVPLTAREHRALRQDVPASATAYELYLRGNQLMAESSRWDDVRQLYERAVELDPGYAPAWARLGRVLRVLAKYGSGDAESHAARAERAFERALALNPDLAMAHHLYAYLQAEIGRATDATVRLLTRARARASDAELLAGLVTTCRYSGLLDASLAAYERAAGLDPAIATSVAYTYYLLGNFDRTIETDRATPAGFAALLAHYRLGRQELAIDSLRGLENETPYTTARLVMSTYRSALEGRIEELLPQISALRSSGFRDPEGLYLLAAFVAAGGAAETALELLDRAVEGGFHNPAAMRRDPLWDRVRTAPAFGRLLAQAEAGHERARDAFRRADGAATLGLAG